MGNNSNWLTKYPQYSHEEAHSLPWAGSYTVLSTPGRAQSLIKKTLYFHSHKQASLFLEKFNSEEQQLEFYLLSPLHAQMGKDEGLCGLA